MESVTDYIFGAALLFAAGGIVGVAFCTSLSAAFRRESIDFDAVNADMLAFSARLRAVEDEVKKAV